jgi:hypothetical protein
MIRHVLDASLTTLEDGAEDRYPTEDNGERTPCQACKKQDSD